MGLFEIDALISPVIVSIVTRDIATLMQMIMFLLKSMTPSIQLNRASTMI